MFSAPVFDSNGILWTGDFGNNGNVYAIDVLGVTGATPGTQLVNSTSDGGAGSPLAADNQGNVYGINFNVNAVDVWTANSTNPSSQQCHRQIHLQRIRWISTSRWLVPYVVHDLWWRPRRYGRHQWHIAVASHRVYGNRGYGYGWQH